MIELILSLLGAFLLYVLVLPLLGLLVGVVLYLGFPYVVGIALASIAHKLFHGSFVDLGAFWLLAVAWTILLVHIRNIYRKTLDYRHAWYEGHYRAARTILLVGHPYRKRKKALAM